MNEFLRVHPLEWCWSGMIVGCGALERAFVACRIIQSDLKSMACCLGGCCRDRVTPHVGFGNFRPHIHPIDFLVFWSDEHMDLCIHVHAREAFFLSITSIRVLAHARVSNRQLAAAKHLDLGDAPHLHGRREYIHFYTIAGRSGVAPRDALTSH